MKQILAMMALLLGMGQQAWADDVTYLYRSWDESTKTVKTETRTANATPLRSVAKNGEWMGLGDGWYYMEGERINIQTLNILGKDVHLILGDGTILECYGGIKLEEGHKLTIYGQSEGGGAGLLWAHQGTDTYIGYKNASGIGGGEAAFIGTLEIHGGRINADGGAYGAGIGHGAFDSKSKTKYTGKIIVYGGTINATGGQSGAGIGSGSGHYDDANDSPEYIQYGGTVTCTGGDNAAGLGGGGGFYKIWGNSAAQGGQIWKATINGGTLTATGGQYGAGIGSGSNSGTKGGEIIINGGTVTATGGVEGAGIGGTSQSYSPVITINGGNVKAYGKGAGIGSGCYSSPTEFNMYGGTVYAEGGFESAGVGGGKNNYGGKISIFGGTLEAVSGEMPEDFDHYRAFGSGNLKDNNDFQDTRPGLEYRRNFLYLGDETHFVKVRIGNSKTELGTQYSLAANRKNDCRTHFHAKVEMCNHDDDGALSYTQVDDEKHHKYCKYCGYQNDEAHNYVGGKCVCGKEGNNEPETWTVTIYQATSSSSTSYGDGKEYKVLKGQQFPVPAPDAIEGLTFMQWKQNPASAPENIEMKDADIDAGAPAALEITPTADVTLYAQYRYAYNEVWTWAADHKTATLTLKQGDVVVKSDIDATVTTEVQEATASENGYKRYTATAKWDKSEGITYQFTDVFEESLFYSLTLKDDADNSAVLKQNDGKIVDVVYERQLTAGKTDSGEAKPRAYTVCLPYDLMLAENDEEYPENVSVYTLWSVDKDKREVTFSEDFPILRAGYAYVVVVKTGTVSLSAKGVTLHAQPAEGDVVYITGGDMRCGTWKGNFAQLTPSSLFQENAYVLQSDGLLHQVQSNAENGLKPFRGYLSSDEAFNIENFTTRFVTIADGDGTEMEVSIDAFVDDSEDNTVDGIIMVQKSDDCDGFYYDLQGRRLTTVPQQPGIYISNGAKVIVR